MRSGETKIRAYGIHKWDGKSSALGYYGDENKHKTNQVKSRTSDIPGGGVGLFATCDIEPGLLLPYGGYMTLQRELSEC